MSPGQINDQHRATHPEGIYRCRKCRTDQNLNWFRGTSCPVCDKQECGEFCEAEWQQALDSNSESE